MNPAPELDDDASGAAEPTPAPEAPVAPAAAAAPRPGLLVRFRDYIWDWRSVVAVALATFIVGGLAGLALGLAMGTGNHSSTRGFRTGPGTFRPGQQGGFGSGQGFNGGQAPNGSGPTG